MLGDGTLDFPGWAFSAGQPGQSQGQPAGAFPEVASLAGQVDSTDWISASITEPD
jgi:hypothetical protein